MGFLKNLFGSKKTSALHDMDLGDFTFLTDMGSEIVWKGQVKFLNETGSLFISGDSNQLDSLQKTSLLEVLKNEAYTESEVNAALLSEYEKADKQYSKWADHFNFNSISTLNNELLITFEEKESFYQFNIFFSNGKQAGVAIDS